MIPFKVMSTSNLRLWKILGGELTGMEPKETFRVLEGFYILNYVLVYVYVRSKWAVHFI